MRLRTASLFLVLAAALCPLGHEARAEEPTQQKPKPTKASVLALNEKLKSASVSIATLAAQPAPQGLTAEQKKTYEAETQKIKALVSGTDAVTAKIAEGLKDTVKNKLDSLSEMGEMESLRLQMAMDRYSKIMSTLSNLLKKQSDTASDITQNLK